MSRNLGHTNCPACDCDEIIVEEARRPITRAEAGAYFDEYEGMLVAKAHCSLCKALLLAWCDETTRTKPPFWHGRSLARAAGADAILDLSWRHAFDDEPSIRDLPLYHVNYGSDGQHRKLVDDLHRAACVERVWPFTYADLAFRTTTPSWEREAVEAWTERLMAEVAS